MLLVKHPPLGHQQGSTHFHLKVHCLCLHAYSPLDRGVELKISWGCKYSPTALSGAARERARARAAARYAAVHKLYIRSAYLSTWNTIQDPGRPRAIIVHCPLCLRVQQLAIDAKHSDHVASVMTRY